MSIDRGNPSRVLIFGCAVGEGWKGMWSDGTRSYLLYAGSQPASGELEPSNRRFKGGPKRLINRRTNGNTGKNTALVGVGGAVGLF